MALQLMSDSLAQPPDSKIDLLAYHMLTHTLITTFHRRLMDITTRRFADEFIMNTAAQVVKNLIGDSTSPIEETQKIIEKYGYQINETHENDHSSWTIRCPFAQKVHPKLSLHDAICPISLLILGAIRLQQQNTIMTQHVLETEGSQFEIKYKD
jgi:hypothetical protein